VANFQNWNWWPYHRLRAWRTITSVLWLAFLWGILHYAGREMVHIRLLDQIAYRPQPGDPPYDELWQDIFDNVFINLNSSLFFHLWLAAWGLAALAKLITVLPFPAKWTDFNQFRWMLICSASVLGFPLTAWIYEELDYLPASWTTHIVHLLLGPLLLPFAGLVTLVGLAAVGAILSFAFVYLLLQLPIKVFEYVNERDIEKSIFSQKKARLGRQLTRFNLWLNGQQLPYIPDDSKGARFAVMPEIERVYDPSPESMAFGHIGQSLFLKTDKHVLIMASTRSGKGVTLIIPHLLRYTGSAFVLDPKGENARATGRHRATLNDEVHFLDPFGISGKPKSRFNPLSRFTPENMEAESKALAAAFFFVGGGDQKRDHWDAAGQQLLAAVILYVYLSPDVDPAQKDLQSVRRCLLGGIKKTLNAMLLIDEGDGLLRDLAKSFLETPEKELGSIISSAQRETEILDNPYIIACLKATDSDFRKAARQGPEVDFKSWRTGTMTVYLCLSAPKFPIFNRWLRLVLTSALDEMTDTLNPPPMPVCFMLDELATLGKLNVVENAVGLAAGYGVQLVNVFQDVAQMRDLYKGRWASFIGNAGVRAVFNLDDLDTAKYWSEFIGGTLVETRGRQEDIYGLSKGDNVGEAMRPLIPPDKIMMEYASGKMLVLAQGQHPIETDRVAYFDDRNFDGLWDDPRAPLPPPEASPSPPFTSAPPPSPYDLKTMDLTIVPVIDPSLAWAAKTSPTSKGPQRVRFRPQGTTFEPIIKPKGDGEGGGKT
jgi:type IV secretion system protein VirD4